MGYQKRSMRSLCVFLSLNTWFLPGAIASGERDCGIALSATPPIIEVGNVQGYDRGEAKVISEDPAVLRFLRGLQMINGTIIGVAHVTSFGGYQTAITEVIVGKRAYADGYTFHERDLPLTFYVRTLPRPASDGSRYTVSPTAAVW